MKRAERHISPRALDWVLNGVTVYIRRRPSDSTVYATIYDYSKFIREEPLETLRIPIGDLSHLRQWEPETDERVQAAMAKYAGQGPV